jgi:hypothetical protein
MRPSNDLTDELDRTDDEAPVERGVTPGEQLLTFAAVLAVVFKPLFGILQRHRVKPSVAAGLVVLGLLAVMTSVFVATVRGVTDQADEIS